MVPGKAPEVQVQLSFINEILEIVEKCKTEKEILLFLDPVHQIHNNENGYCIQKVGKEGTKRVLSNTGRRRVNIIGAINPIDMGITTLITECKCDSEVMKIFLKEIRNTYDEGHIITIILDNASYNRSYEVQDLAKELQINLKYLPPYSPNLSLIERLWKFFKKKMVKNHYYSDFETFYNAIIAFFKDFDNYKEEIKTLITFNFEIIKAN